MKIKALILALFAAGLLASFAVAEPPPGKGKPGLGNSTTSSSTSSTSTTSSTTTTTGKKVQVCHRTGSSKKPFHLITVSRNALAAHLAHGDVMPSGGKCPTSRAGGSTTTSTTSASPSP